MLTPVSRRYLGYIILMLLCAGGSITFNTQTASFKSLN